MGPDILDELVEIVGQSPYCTFFNCWNSTIMGRLKVFGYKNMWSTWIHHKLPPPPTMIAKGCKLLNVCLFVRTAVYLSIKFKLVNAGNSELTWRPLTPRWPEFLSLHFLEFLWCSLRWAFGKGSNGNYWCLLSQIDSGCSRISFQLRQDSKKLRAFIRRS